MPSLSIYSDFINRLYCNLKLELEVRDVWNCGLGCAKVLYFGVWLLVYEERTGSILWYWCFRQTLWLWLKTFPLIDVVDMIPRFCYFEATYLRRQRWWDKVGLRTNMIIIISFQLNRKKIKIEHSVTILRNQNV